MATRGWLFGEVPGNPEGTAYRDRQALSEAGVHAPPEAGMWGRQNEGCVSIVVNGGYEDDDDRGDEVIYTGHGGQNRGGGPQVRDQELTLANRGLARNAAGGLPVRVIRGPKARFDPPKAGFRYDGLYRVVQYRHERGKSRFRVYRYWLEKLPSPGRPDDGSAAGEQATPAPAGRDNAPRVASTVQRLVRNNSVTQWVKEIHEYACQVCGLRLETPAGPYGWLARRLKGSAGSGSWPKC